MLMPMIAVRDHYQGTLRRGYDLLNGALVDNRHRIRVQLPEGIDAAGLEAGELVASGVPASDARETERIAQQLVDEGGLRTRVALYKLRRDGQTLYFSVSFDSDTAGRGTNGEAAELSVLDGIAAAALWARLPYRRGAL